MKDTISRLSNDVWTPNIVGSIAWGGCEYTPSVSGSFIHNIPHTITTYYWAGSGGSGSAGYSFDGSVSSAKYSGEDVVQVPSVQALVCIKI